jgi:Ca2+-binding EF-hand superfamily protein
MMAGKTADPVELKIEYEFDKLDGNHDGYIEWSDYEALVGRYKKTAKVNENDRRVRALEAFYRMHWLELLRHADIHEDRLSKSQYVTATRLATSDENRLKVSEVGAHVIFDLIDVDGDDAISNEELTRFLDSVWKIDKSDAVYGLDALGSERSKKISRDDFVNGINEHLE